jgi:TRAP-type C4-dicarboxylate transport system permease small subunit
MKRILDGCEAGMLYIGCFMTFVLMLLTTADAFGRYLFNSPIIGAYEITANYLMVGSIFLSVAYGYRRGAYIRVTFLMERLGGKVKIVINQVVQMGSLLYGFLLVAASLRQVFRVYGDQTSLSSFDFPLWPAYVFVPVGLFVMSLMMLIDFRKVKTGGAPLFKDESPQI